MYGRQTLTGVLASKGLKAGEKRVGESLRLVLPLYSQARRHSVARMKNPGTYQANYFGQKLHIDQNEKNVMFGVTHICAVDGFSRKIVAFTTMPIKTTTLFTRQCIGITLRTTSIIRAICTVHTTISCICTSVCLLLFRQIICHYGMWDQLRVDQGKEWYLMLYMQEQLAEYRRNPSAPPHLQTSSTQVRFYDVMK